MIFNIAHSSPALPTFTCSFKPTTAQCRGRWKPAITATSLPAARDRVIDFGKYKGKMLGALPSSYLKWVSGNLRSGDTHHWTHLADQVLEDPIYRDRLEWEFASRILDAGNDGGSVPSSASAGTNAVAQLLEVSQRFGWDNDDKIGWSRVNFELLGTSKGGRIPRVTEEKEGLRDDQEQRNAGGGRCRISGGDGELESEEKRRRERRERMRLRKAAEVRMEKERLGISGEIGDNSAAGDRQFSGRGADPTAGIRSRFPGREGLLKKVIEGKRGL